MIHKYKNNFKYNILFIVQYMNVCLTQICFYTQQRREQLFVIHWIFSTGCLSKTVWYCTSQHKHKYINAKHSSTASCISHHPIPVWGHMCRVVSVFTVSKYCYVCGFFIIYFILNTVSKMKQTLYTLWVLHQFEASRYPNNRHMKVVRLSALHTGRLYP